MHTTTLLAGVLTVALVPTAAIAAKPPKPPKPPGNAPALTLAAAPNPTVFTKPLALSGKLSGPGRAGIAVRFEQDQTRPYGDSYKPTGLVATTTQSGFYSFGLKPAKNTQYRAVAQTSPPVTSPPRLVNVRPLVGLRVSTRTPKAGRSVRFSGIVLPLRTGTALVQRRGSTGAFVTVARRALTASGAGSTYAVRARVRRPGEYRVKVPGTREYVNGLSRSIALATR